MSSKSIDANYAVLQPVIKVGTSYSWTDPGTLEITARFVEESLGTQAIVCRFSEINGSIGVTIGPKSAPGMMGSPGRAQPPAGTVKRDSREPELRRLLFLQRPALPVFVMEEIVRFGQVCDLHVFCIVLKGFIETLSHDCNICKQHYLSNFSGP